MRFRPGIVLLAVALLACGEEPSGPSDAGVRVDGGPDAGFVPVCDPPCAADEVCDGRQTPPACMPACNAPAGCQPGIEVCNTKTGKCEPVSCDGKTCEKGQRCVNLTTSGTEPPLTCTCLPRRPDPSNRGALLEDTCASQGMACERRSADEVPFAGRCLKPGAKERCVASVGCRDNLVCADVGGASFCTQPCTAPADCPDPADTCRADLKNRCWYNPCAQNDRSLYFKPCRTEGGDDGTCVPLGAGDNDFGVCVLAGTAAAGEACNPEGTRALPAERCVAGHWCAPLQPGGTPGTVRGLCVPLCNAAPPATALPQTRCATGQVCENLLGPAAEQDARLGVCRTRCELKGSDTCPTDALGNPQGCFPLERADAVNGV
ncbi:MAG: hypothetical protein ACK4N5_23460, partial [Myxococcales bacterium]